jgi:hypothetical protein
MCDCDPPIIRVIDAHEPQPAYTGLARAMMATRFNSFDEFKTVVQIEYLSDTSYSAGGSSGKPAVRLSHCSNGMEVFSVLQAGISQADFLAARDGNLWDRISFAFSCPYAVLNKTDLQRVYVLSRRKPHVFGEGDMAFYDLAVASVANISTVDLAFMHGRDTTEKGYINTFNHVTAQAFITSIFSEKMADFVADVHERYSMPELISGKFTPDQLTDSLNNPVDNYVDMLNNEWGQELGKQLREKYGISRETVWTPVLLANYLNDLQGYYSWALQIGFKPYRPTDEVVTKFSDKINRVFADVSTLN